MMVLASAISSSTSLCSSTTSTKSPLYTLSSSLYNPKPYKFHLSPWFPQLGRSIFSSYSGLKHLGISKSLKLVRKRRSCGGKVVRASLFGVGAPEALVIGVVALLVFGPKGLAEVARNLGKTLRAFQPTIRELQDVSREFKSTLEREIGIDDITTQNPSYYADRRNTGSTTPPAAVSVQDPQNVAEPNGAPSPNTGYTSEEYLKITEEQLKATAAQQLEQKSPAAEITVESQTQSQGIVRETTKVSENEA